MYKYDFSIIIVTYNSEKDIIPCIKSINENSFKNSVEIIIVDNDSKDSTFALLKTLNYDKLKIIRNSENIGFSRACNKGVNLSNGKYLFFCNPDIVIMNDIFMCAKEHFKEVTIGCIGPRILSPDGSDAPFAFKFPHPTLLLLKAFFRNLLRKSNAKILQLNYSVTSDLIECDWVLGACILIPKDVFFQVGGFDEDFFLYFEDVDLCKRIKKAGYKIIADRNCLVVHKKYGSSRNVARKKLINIRIDSELMYYRKHHNFTGYLLSKFLDRSGYLFRA